MTRKDQVERTMYRYLAFLLAACVVSTIHLGWAAIVAWILSSISLMTLFYLATGEKPKANSGRRTNRRRR